MKLAANPEYDLSQLEDLKSDPNRPGKKKNRRRFDHVDNESTKRPKLDKDPEAPKRSLSTFIYFSQQAWDEIRRDYPYYNGQ